MYKLTINSVITGSNAKSPGFTRSLSVWNLTSPSPSKQQNLLVFFADWLSSVYLGNGESI